MNTQRGNALFLILIAVALFAALSYAITQSGRGGGTISKEQAVISASQITQYAASIRVAVQRMVISGTPVGDITFDDATTNSVFNASGGGATPQSPPASAQDIYAGGLDGTTANAWGYKDIADATLGYYVTDIGTNTDVTGREALAYLYRIPLSVCQQINKGLGLNETPATNSPFKPGEGAGKGLPTYGAPGGTLDGAPGQPFACVEYSDEPIYYHTLIEQ